jgi:exodeoxyribonuclease VII large subunit
MPADDQMPSLAGLRRNARSRGISSAAPSLFDELPFAEKTEASTPTAADVIAEVSRGLNADALRDLLRDLQRDVPLAISAPSPQQAPQQPAAARVWSVGELVREVRGAVEKKYAQVTIEGEISNWRPAGSGHCYFTLKDGVAQLSVVMFRKQALLLGFKPCDGGAVRARGQLSVYESRGQMQLIAESMEEVGQGAQLAAVQRLKERLRAEGLFDRKRPLPAFPHCIGVITSLHGAALRDIVKVCRRRHAAVNLLLYPVAVQGPRCAAEVIAALRWFSEHAERADVVLLARGGGSWEDLHGFDDEGVARAIAACALPVISGIGHATDSTISDAAADLCAPTPSAAAELVTAAQFRLEDRVLRLHARLERAGRYDLLRARQRFSLVHAESALRRWVEGLAGREQLLDEFAWRAAAAVHRGLRVRRERVAALQVRMQRQAPATRLANDRRRADALQHRLASAWVLLANRRMQRTQTLASRVDALSPLRVLERGYALVYGPDGKLLRSSENVVPYDTITARLAHGLVRARVTTKLE